MRKNLQNEAPSPSAVFVNDQPGGYRERKGNSTIFTQKLSGLSLGWLGKTGMPSVLNYTVSY
jgi:hypothetical protein